MSHRSSKPPPRRTVPPGRTLKTSRAPSAGIPRLYQDSIEPGESSEYTETFIAPESMRAKLAQPTLTVLSGMDLDRVFPIEAKSIWIGRDETCELRLQDRGVSRRHASVSRNSAEFIIRDNEAKNGTYVNGRRIDEHRLRPGDEIQVGPYVSLLFSTGTGAEERRAQQQATRDELLNEQMYAERVEGLAHLVTSMAHELNTPLGVATTAHGLISTLSDELQNAEPGAPFNALLSELREATALIGRNLNRANQLVRSFKQLSARQLSDEYMTYDLASVIEDCFAALAPDTSRREITVRMRWPGGATFPWSGYPGHLTQVLITLTRNVLAHAYREGESGRVDISLVDERTAYRLEFRDYGAGIQEEIFRRLFEPFVTSARDVGAMGLGLAVAHNIVTNILGGQITCSSVVGKGTTVLIRIPRTCAREEDRDSDASANLQLTPGRRAE